MVTRIILASALLWLASIPARAQDAIDRLDMRAHAAFDDGKYDDAIALWSEVIKRDPKDSTAWFNRATAYDLDKQPDKALADFTEDIRLDPADPEAYASRAELYNGRRQAAIARGETDKEDADKEVADYSALIKLKPDAAGYLVRAAAYREMQEYDKAIADCNTVIQFDPKSAADSTMQGYELRADTYIAKGDWDKAMADYDKMIALAPNNADAYCLRGQAYSMKGEWDKAIADYSQMIQMGSDPAFGYKLRAQAYLQKGDCDKTLADAGEAIKINANDAEAIALRGNAYASKGEYDKALDDYNHLITANPDFAEAYNAEAWLYATCDKVGIRNGAKAVELAQKACELTQWKNASFLDTLAAAEAETGKWDDAVKHQKQAVEAGKAANEGDVQVKDYASRIPLYEQKKPYRDLPKEQPAGN